MKQAHLPASNPEGGYERERVGQKHLPRLKPEWYQGRAAVFWTMNVHNRQKGWLTQHFHGRFREVLLHTCIRHSLVCPAYVLMPDHAHLILLGTNESSDQRRAITFLRSHTREALHPARWQHQPHDHVLRDQERKRNAFQTAVRYTLDNPVRGNLAEQSERYPYAGCALPGFPSCTPFQKDYWDVFWSFYNKQVSDPQPTRSRS
jgi:REP element-mobilizing transposase RayT